MTEQPPRFPQDLTDDALDRCILECERAARMTAEDWAYLEMLKDEREDRQERREPCETN